MKRLNGQNEIIADSMGEPLAPLGRSGRPCSFANAVAYLSDCQLASQEDAMESWAAAQKLLRQAEEESALLEESEHKCLEALVTRCYPREAMMLHGAPAVLLNRLTAWLRSAESVDVEQLHDRGDKAGGE